MLTTKTNSKQTKQHKQRKQISSFERKARKHLRELYFDYLDLVYYYNGDDKYRAKDRVFRVYCYALRAFQAIFPNLENEEPFEDKWYSMWKRGNR